MACELREVITWVRKSRQDCLARVAGQKWGSGLKLTRGGAAEHRSRADAAHRILQEPPSSKRSYPCGHSGKPIQERNRSWTHAPVYFMRQRGQAERPDSRVPILAALPPVSGPRRGDVVQHRSANVENLQAGG